MPADTFYVKDLAFRFPVFINLMIPLGETGSVIRADCFNKSKRTEDLT